MNDPRKKYVFVSFFVLLILNSLFINAQHGSDLPDSISLGLLVNKQNETAAVCSAILAIDEVNKHGGIKGKPLKLVIGSVEGSWGAGSSKAVDMVFKEKAVAIIGSIDGRNSHLAEQVIAKTQVTYLSVWASDPSLSKAYVPWYFTAVPTDDQQAAFFLKEISKKKGSHHILVVHDQSYDARQALKSLYGASNEFKGFKISSIGSRPSEVKDMLSRTENEHLDAIIFLGRQIPFSAIAKQLEVLGKAMPFYANIAAQSAEGYSDFQHESMGPSSSIITDDRSGIAAKEFQKEFSQKCHIQPGPVSAYVYDGIKIISKALQHSGNDGSKLQKSMSEINYQGVTGAIRFDSQGRLKNTGELLLSKE